MFETKSVFTKLILKQKLIILKLTRGEKLEDHFLMFVTLIRDLENAGSKMVRRQDLSYMLLSLNEDCQAVITASKTMNKDIKMDFVKFRLLLYILSI